MGINKVLDLFKYLLEVDNSYILYLLTPGYESLSKKLKPILKK